MADERKPSFTPGLKWSIGLNVLLIVIVVLSVVAMVNYLDVITFCEFTLIATGSTNFPR